METTQTVEPEQSEEVILRETIDLSDNMTAENISTSKCNILKRFWTFFLEHPIAVITCVGILLGGIGTFFIGINAIRSNNSNLSLSGEDIFKFTEAVKSEDTSQIEKFLERVKGNPEAPVLDRAIAEAFKLQTNKKIDEAIEKWESIANIAEKNDNTIAAGAWFSAGNLLLQQGRHGKAIFDFSKALNLKQDYVQAYHRRAAAKLNIGEFKEAIDDCDKALEQDPDNAETHYNRGFANLSLSKYKDAGDDFRKALDLKPDYTEAKWGLKETKSYLESAKLLNLNTTHAEEYYSRGIVRLDNGEFKESIGDFDKALKLNPDYVEAYYDRGAAKFNIEQYQSAVADYNKVILLNPEFPSAYANRGEAKSRLRQYESAITDCDKAIQLDPNYAYAYYIRADAKFHIGDIAGEESDLKTALKIAEKVNDEKLKDKIELRFFLKNLLHRNHGKRDETLQKNSN